jgi:hypothetical protein
LHLLGTLICDVMLVCIVSITVVVKKLSHHGHFK